jgi:hypothetical protein
MVLRVIRNSFPIYKRFTCNISANDIRHWIRHSLYVTWILIAQNK